jgi:hypothetical protein
VLGIDLCTVPLTPSVISRSPDRMSYGCHGQSSLGGFHISSTIFALIEATTREVQETVVQSMGYLACSRGLTNYPYAADTADHAVLKGIELLEQLRDLRSTLREVATMGP